MTYAVLTQNGTRSVNEDSVGTAHAEGRDLFVLADGLGGHGGGEVASRIAVDAASALFENCAEEAPIAKMIEDANREILEKQLVHGFPEDMKTTMVCLTIENSIAKWGHVGDSRLYLFRKKKALLRTLDHSVPQALVLAGRLREKQIRFHEDRSRLLRALGVREKELEIDVAEPMPLLPGDVFLLCSDGFWEWLTEKEMQSRYEIILKNYCSLVNIEGKTMVDMALKDILPAVSKYSGTLCDTLLKKKSVCKKLDCRYEEEMIAKSPRSPKRRTSTWRLWKKRCWTRKRFPPPTYALPITKTTYCGKWKNSARQPTA